jgi:hypothetical protein
MTTYDKNELYVLVGDTLLPETVLEDLDMLFDSVEEEIEFAEEDDSFSDADMIQVLILKSKLALIKGAFTELQSFLADCVVE